MIMGWGRRMGEVVVKLYIHPPEDLGGEKPGELADC
jgi:hypothetical protein